jgi:chromosome segregation ATPase
MKNELESRLDEENEKAQQLELLIRGKEEHMERMRKDFDDLRIQMEKETDLKRNEITNLNGEVVEKSSLLSSREREFLQLKADMDELKLKYDAEVTVLKKQIDEFGANEKEVQKIHRKNIALEGEVANLRNEIRRLHMSGNDFDNPMSPQSSVRVLRTRNEELKGEVEKLQRKLRHMKRNVTRIEL